MFVTSRAVRVGEDPREDVTRMQQEELVPWNSSLRQQDPLPTLSA